MIENRLYAFKPFRLFRTQRANPARPLPRSRREEGSETTGSARDRGPFFSKPSLLMKLPPEAPKREYRYTNSLLLVKEVVGHQQGHVARPAPRIECEVQEDGITVP